MSEPTLYREALPGKGVALTEEQAEASFAITLALRAGVLVPVERCEHGYLDPHHWYESGDTHEPTACPGAGIGDNK